MTHDHHHSTHVKTGFVIIHDDSSPTMISCSFLTGSRWETTPHQIQALHTRVETLHLLLQGRWLHLQPHVISHQSSGLCLSRAWHSKWCNACSTCQRMLPGRLQVTWNTFVQAAFYCSGDGCIFPNFCLQEDCSIQSIRQSLTRLMT